MFNGFFRVSSVHYDSEVDEVVQFKEAFPQDQG